MKIYSSNYSRTKVKLRLRAVSYVAYSVSIFVMFAVMVGMIYLFAPNIDADTESTWINLLLTFFIYSVPLLVFFGTIFSMRRGAIILGWMTREEAKHFPLKRSRWPEEWFDKH